MIRMSRYLSIPFYDKNLEDSIEQQVSIYYVHL